MASGKLSPRQKMINMMYLVLLALLAMNVSKEILDSFEIISGKLNSSANLAQGNASAFIDNMKKEIQDEKDNQGKTTNFGLIDTLDQLSKQTGDMITLLDGHIAEMRKMAGEDPQTGELKKKDELEKNYQYWIGAGADDENGGRGNGKAFELRNSIDGYNEYIKNIFDANIGKDGDKMPAGKLEDKKGQDGKVKTWEKYTFDAPVVGNIAMLEALKLDVYEKQKELLDLLNGRLGVATFKVDKVVPVNAPTATIVPAGLEFQTKLYIAMSSSTIKPTFSSSSGKITNGEDGNSGILTIPASGNVIPKGKNQGTQKYTASIRVPKATGGFDVLPVEGEFVVRRPEVVITSASVQNLYRNCGNDVNIDVPALGNRYNPIIKASSAQVIPSKKDAKKFRIIPTAKECNVAVSSNTNGRTTAIGIVKYKVIKPPKPSIDMAVNGKRTSGATPVSKNSRVQIKVVPDGEFRSALPGDAQYGVTSIDVLAALSLGPPQKVNTVKGKLCHSSPITVGLGSRVRQARAGTKVYIRLNEIYRKNFQGKNIPDKRFSEAERMLSIVVK